MKIYLAEYAQDHENTTFVGAFSSDEKAWEAIYKTIAEKNKALEHTYSAGLYQIRDFDVSALEIDERIWL